ncbi:MAG: hypothetical protein HQM00_05390 [Magnetococcales bacterium]|nr:hypothetical protein [Magnetococcales bacterium]
MKEVQVDREWFALRERVAGWIRDFLASPRSEVLTAIQKRGCGRIVERLVETLWRHHGRTPEKWTAATVERCCLDALPADSEMNDTLIRAMPAVLMAFFGFLQESGHISNGTVLMRAVNRAWERGARNGERSAAHRGKRTAELLDPESGDTLEGLRLFAGQIAREIARQRPALISREAMESFERQPILVFDLVQLLSEEFLASETPDEYRVSAYFMLLSHALRNIRFGIERRFEWALELDREFQALVVKRAGADLFSPQLLAGIVESLSEAKLEPSRELLEVYEQRIMHHAPREEMPTRSQIDAMFENLVDEHGGDPFAIGETLAQMTRALPLEAQSALIGEFACSTLPGMKDAVVVLCLHAEESVRREALQWLLKNARSVTPTALRRLIVIRNWLPDGERKALDTLIKTARVKGVECAHWAEGLPLQKLQSSRMDGVGALSLLLSMPVKPGKSRIGGVLLKQGVGVSDAWLTPPISRREAAATFRQVWRQEFFLDVSQDFLHAAIRHHLAVGLAAGRPPSVGLLQLAEAVVATSWVPERLDGRVLSERLIGEERVLSDDAATVTRIIETSDAWSDQSSITGSWFEESQEVVDFLEKTRMRGRERLIRRVLELFCEPNREIWADRCAWTAFWLREQSGKERRMEGLEFHFAVLARELYRGRPLYELPLMRRVAERTMGGEE